MKDFWKLLEERSNEETLENAAFTVDATELKNALARLTPAYRLDRKSPILNCVKFIFNEYTQTLTLTLTSLEITMQTTIPASGHKPACFCLLYAGVKKFVGFTRASKVGFYYAESERFWLIKAGTASMKIAMLPISDFPETQAIGHEFDVITIADAERFAGDLTKAARFVSHDDSRKYLTGVRVVCEEGRLQLVATNGKRLFLAKSAAFAKPHSTSFTPGFTLPIKAAAAVTRLYGKSKEPVACHINQGSVTFHSGADWLVVKTIEGDYVNYRLVIPQSFTHEVELSAFVLKWGVDCIGGVKGCYVEFEVKPDALHLTHHNTDSGFEVEAEIPAVTDNAEPGSKIMFNGGYLSDAVAAGEALKMRWNDHLNPVTILNDDYTYVIMPIRGR